MVPLSYIDLLAFQLRQLGQIHRPFFSLFEMSALMTFDLSGVIWKAAKHGKGDQRWSKMLAAVLKIVFVGGVFLKHIKISLHKLQVKTPG